MKRLAFLLASLFISISAFSQMVRENPVAGCKITKDYGTISVTYYLSCSVHLAKEGEFAELKIYIARNNEYADMVIKFVDFKPRFCGEWRMTENEGYAIKFVDSPEKANFTVKFGNPEVFYGFSGAPA